MGVVGTSQLVSQTPILGCGGFVWWPCRTGRTSLGQGADHAAVLLNEPSRTDLV